MDVVSAALAAHNQLRLVAVAFPATERSGASTVNSKVVSDVHVHQAVIVTHATAKAPVTSFGNLLLTLPVVRQ
jgi:hypothetical protein